MREISVSELKEKIANKETMLVSFSASWCGPCKMVAPVLEELSTEYEGKILIYKVNTDIEQELSGVFGIQSIPSFLFIDAKGEPHLQPGAFPKHVFKKVIDEHLLNITSEENPQTEG